jgi:hypothetical protein
MVKAERRIFSLINDNLESGKYSKKDKEFLFYMWKGIKKEFVEFTPVVHIMNLGYFNISKKKLFDCINRSLRELKSLRDQGITYGDDHKHVILFRKYFKVRNEVKEFYSQKRSRLYTRKSENVSLQDK